MLQAAASELANRQRAMNTAVTNAEDIVRQYTRLANSARQSEITQEISEIVSGADALARPRDRNESTMTPTAKTAKAPAEEGARRRSDAAAAPARRRHGRVARVIGPVVDIEFPADAHPRHVQRAHHVEIDLSAQGEGEGVMHMTLEVAQHLGDNMVRAIALKPTDGLVRGARRGRHRRAHLGARWRRHARVTC